MDGRSILRALNSAQAAAVEWCDGPELVMAGAGSGKTRVLASKIAYLIAEKKVPPNRILALTFTNKAAAEMLERVKSMVGGDLRGMQVSTFHSYGMRFLFRNASSMASLGYPSNFVIFDRGDCRNAAKKIARHLGLDAKGDDNRSLADRISRAYANCDPATLDPDIEERWRPAYDLYRDELKRQGALDFDDLMMMPLHILLNDRDALESERNRVEWTLVDECQDVNSPQYLLLKTLAGGSGRLMAVGDPDQSIYGWRGADMSLMMGFEDDFRGARVIVLDRNYRSTSNILAAANSVIRNNRERRDKNLWTDSAEGAPVRVTIENSDRDEYAFITDEIERLVLEDGYRYGDISILYRVNALSRGYEQALLERGIPYGIVRGVAFYDRREVKDVLSMLRLSANPRDAASLERIANIPARGLGPKGTARLALYLSKALGEPREIWGGMTANPPLKGKQGEGAAALAKTMLRVAEEESLGSAIDFILYNAGYEEYIRDAFPEDWEDRLQNVREMTSIMPDDGSAAEALAQAALFTDQDSMRFGDSHVSLMTLHAAKGLEFPVVFLAGLEDGIFPSERSLDEPGGLEEERRICYVGMTRAKERLYMSGVTRRVMFGEFRTFNLSRFISELSDSAGAVKIDDRTRLGASGQARVWRIPGKSRSSGWWSS
ncbi:MAG: UvrD-helicase domain-containing protein [Synergistaceae bacterium]|nr:UvrD-helicase domain-containing protein [Synergistaceae bacterium]